MFILGITGIVASGKSTVCAILRKNGFQVINTDKIGHALLKKDKNIKSKVQKVFRTTVRSKLAQIVFSNKNKLKILNKIMHPAMKKEIIKQLNEFRIKKAKGVVVEAAVFAEMKLKSLVDEVWLIKSKRKNIYMRLKKKGFKTEEIEQRLQNTTNNTQVLKIISRIIYNNKTHNALEKNIKNIIKSISQKLNS